MRRISYLLAIVVILTISGISAAENEPESDLGKENAELKARVEKLQKRVRELESELARRSFVLPTPPTQPSPFYIPNPFSPPRPKSPMAPVVPAPQRVPPGWQERKFNGLHYYLIPLLEIAKPEIH